MARSNRFLLVMFAALCACAGARAADLPSPSAPLPPPPAIPQSDPWSGPWLGVYGGYGFANPNSGFSVTGDPNDVTPAIASQVDGSGAGAISADGFLGGVQGGWNLRLTTDVVIGVEADVGYAGLRGGRQGGSTIPAPYNAPYVVSQHYSTDWQAALRVRGGYLINPATLLFAEAGPAFGGMRYGASFSDYVPAANYSEIESASATAFKVGLTLGGGVEYLIGPNLSVRAEYLYTRFPSVNMSGTSNLLLPVPAPGYVAHSSGALNQNTFKVGLNYLFR
jgi:opacity protein-like surface antigen